MLRLRRGKMCQAFLALIVLLIATCFIGCSSRGETSNAQPHMSHISSDPPHIADETEKNSRVDTSVMENLDDGDAGIYEGKVKRFSREDIDNFFTFCGTSIVSSNESEGHDEKSYAGVCENGSKFSYLTATNHPYSQFIYRNDDKAEIYWNYPIYTNERDYLTNSKYMVGWMFTEPKNFSFATAAEAEKNSREALSALGLSDLKLLRTLYCDHKTLEEAMQVITTAEEFGPLGATIENNGFEVKDDWSEADDAYLFSFGIPVNGIPLSYRDEQSNEKAWYTGCSIVVWYAKDGIISLSVDTPWEVGEEIEAPIPIVSAQIAQETVEKKFSYNLEYKDMRIDEVRLEYHYIQDRHKWLLKPVWAVALSYANDEFDDRYYIFTNIDALTGNEM